MKIYRYVIENIKTKERKTILLKPTQVIPRGWKTVACVGWHTPTGGLK